MYELCPDREIPPYTQRALDFVSLLWWQSVRNSVECNVDADSGPLACESITLSVQAQLLFKDYFTFG